MKPLTLLLAASLAANAALLGLFALRPALAPPAFRDFFKGDASRSADLATESRAQHARAAAQSDAAAARRAGVWAALQTDDLRTLIARLCAAGFSPVLVRAIVNARLEAAFSARMNELLGTLADTRFWKPEPFSSSNNPRFYENYNQLYRDRAKALRELLGDDYFASGGGDATAAQRRQFGDLPKAKIDLIQRINDDYTEMMSQIRAATQGIMLPEDREKLALLEREKRTDLAAILSPAELEDYEMRNSPITSRLRTALTLIDATDAEFRAIYLAQQPFAALLFPTERMVFTSETSLQRNAAQQQIADQLRAVLGEQRYADYARASDYEYQNLFRMAQHDNIATDTINRAYDLRASTAQDSMRINDAKLGADERNAALRALALATRTQLIGVLGVNVAESYLKNSSWFGALEKGYAIKLGANGQGMTYYSGPPPPR